MIEVCGCFEIHRKRQPAPSIGTQDEVTVDPGLRRSKEGHFIAWEGTYVQSPSKSQLFEKCGVPRPEVTRRAQGRRKVLSKGRLGK